MEFLVEQTITDKKNCRYEVVADNGVHFTVLESRENVTFVSSDSIQCPVLDHAYNIHILNSARQIVSLKLEPFRFDKYRRIWLNVDLRVVDSRKHLDNHNITYRRITGKGDDTLKLVLTAFRFMMYYICNHADNMIISLFASDSRRLKIYKKFLYKYGFELITYERIQTLYLTKENYKNIYNDRIIKVSRGRETTVYTCSNCPHSGNLMYCHNCPKF